MDSLKNVELLLSGGGAALMALLAVKFYTRPQRTCVEISGFAFCVLAAFHMLANHYEPMADQGAAGLLFLIAGSLDTAIFWILAQALFDDKYRMRPLHMLPLVAVALTWVVPQGIWVRDAIIIALMLHVMLIGLRDYKSDLVDARRSFRLALAVLVPVMVMSTTIASVAPPANGAVMELIDAIKFMGLAGLFSVWMTRLDGELVNGRAAEPVHDVRPVPVADRLEMERVRSAVQNGICFEPGLTIGVLAQRIDIPEHRLRKLINQGLGYRNFAAFLNDHRIEEAKRRLSDPDQARAQIVTHAFALGYNSLAPFNRAFRERVGQSPTAYRTEALEQVIA